MLKSLKAARDALPEGYVIVPLEPTKEMVLAGESAIDGGITSTQDSYEAYEIYDKMELAGLAYRAMIADAQK